MAKVKKVFKFVFLVLLVLFTFRSCVYASISNDNYVYKKIDFNGTREEALQSVWELFNYPWITENSTSANNQSAMLNVLTDYDYFILFHNTSGNNLLYLTLSPNEDMSGASRQQRYYLAPNGPSAYIYFFDTLKSSRTGYSVDLSNKDYILKYKNGEYYEYSANNETIVNDTFNFEPNYDAITNYNGYQQLYTKKYDYSINNWLIGNLTPSEKYNIYDIQLLDVGGNILFRDTYNNEFGTNTSDKFFISRVDSNLYIKSMALSYNKIYTLVIYPKDSSGNISDNNFVGTFMYLPLNAVISGDSVVSSGSGDYTVQDQANVIDDLVSGLFTLESGDVESLYNDVIAYFPSGDRPDQIFDIIFGNLNGEPSDFIISWNNIPVGLTVNGGETVFESVLVSGDSINFSELCRDNDTFALIKFYINLFVAIFFTLAYISTLYKCLLIMLGLSTDFVGDLIEPEHRQIGFINDWRDKK